MKQSDFIMSKHINSSVSPASVSQKKSKKHLFGLTVEELKMVTGGGGVIIEGPVYEVPRKSPAPQPAPLPAEPVTISGFFGPTRR
jgi:hypothetical protein